MIETTSSGIDADHPLLVWGGGAIGGTLAAYWARAGLPVRIVDIAVDHVRACSGSGLHVHGPVDDFVQRVDACTPDALRGRYSRIVLAVKAQATEAAAASLEPHLRKDGFVLSAQNGLNEIALSRILGADRVMGCFVNFGADWHGPGDILYGNRGAVVVGETDGSTRQRTRHMHALLKLFEPGAVLTDNIWGYLWGKLAYGSMLVATALTNESMSENFADPRRFRVFLELGREVMALAEARGVTPMGFDGFRPEAFQAGAPEANARAVIAALAAFNARTSKTHSGVWRDLAVRKRQTEVAGQYGVLLHVARDSGLKIPTLERLLVLIGDIESGRRAQGEATFEALMEVCV
ncbi:ketopantoate reductase family protein [Rubrivivax albus]|uniref:ketopantoate reductase family protein n=1 Tax=Rubrivivax albus TaxID=2499835 RepID=UPI0018EEC3F6|nr:ketopantoate reductase family protein [Rubrivivax albus]